jgi:hypothetical protein
MTKGDQKSLNKKKKMGDLAKFKHVFSLYLSGSIFSLSKFRETPYFLVPKMTYFKGKKFYLSEGRFSFF